MALFRCSSGGSTTVKRGTLTTSTASTDVTINTGLSNITEFWLHGYATSYGYTMQHAIYYTADDAENFQTVTRYASNGVNNRYAIGQSALANGYVIKSIVGGIVTITTPSNVSWASNNLNWTAF